MTAFHSREVNLSKEACLSFLSFFSFSFDSYPPASIGLTIQFLKLHEGLNTRCIRGPQTVGLQTEKIGAE